MIAGQEHPDPAAHRRQHRTNIDQTGRLWPIDPSTGEGDTLEITFRDVSLGGAMLISTCEIPLGSLWQLCTYTEQDRKDGAAVIVRRCQALGESQWELGVQLLWPAETLLPLGLGYRHLLNEYDLPRDVKPSPRFPATLTSTSSMEIGHATGINVQVEGDLTLKQLVQHCDLNVSGNIEGRGVTIVGGLARFSGGMSVETLGDRQGTPTFVNPDPRVLAYILHQRSQRYDEIAELMQNETDQLEKLGDRRTHEQRERSMLLTYELTDINGQREAIAKKLELAQRLIAKPGQISINISGSIHAGVEFMDGSLTYRVTDAIDGPVTIDRNTRGQLILRHGSDQGPLESLKQVATTHSEVAA